MDSPPEFKHVPFALIEWVSELFHITDNGLTRSSNRKVVAFICFSFSLSKGFESVLRCHSISHAKCYTKNKLASHLVLF